MATQTRDETWWEAQDREFTEFCSLYITPTMRAETLAQAQREYDYADDPEMLETHVNARLEGACLFAWSMMGATDRRYWMLDHAGW